MDISTIKQKIAALEAEIVPNSVSPERVASILSDITSLVENMGYLGYEFLGVATPTASPSFDKDLTAKKYFYIAVQQGTYTNFGGLTVGANDGLTILAYNGTWTKTATGTAMKTDITGVQNQITQLNTKITAAKNLIQRINAYIEETAAVNLGITYSELSTKVQSGDIKALQDPNGSLYGVIVSDGTLYAYCQLTNTGGAYPLAGASYSLTDAGSGNIKIEREDEMKLPYLDENNKIPELMLPDDINTLKSKARYEYSLSKILALTDISGESAVEEAFTPTYAPEGSLSPRVPKAGDLLIDGNNTVVVSEGTQIFFSFTYQEEIISMRVYSGGSSFRFNVWKFPAGTVYDFNSIDTLTESSTADDIKEALTPKIGDGMRIPNSGDIMEIGIEENPDTVIVLYRYRNTFAYYHNRLLTTIEVNGEDDSLSVVKTVSKNYVYDFDKINALTNASTFSDILHAFSPLIMGSYTLLPKTGDLLTSGYDEEGNAVRSAKVIYHNGNSFAYCYGGKHVTVELVGELGNPDMKIEKTETDLAEAGYEPKKYDYDKVMALSNESTQLDVGEAFTPIGGDAMEWPMPGDLLVSTDDRNHSMFLTNTHTTKSNAPVYLQILNMTNAGAVIHVIGIRGGTAVASAYDIDLDKEVESSDVEFSLQLHNKDLLAICKEGEILPSDEIHFYRRGRYSTNLHSDISSRYRNRKDGWRNSNNYSGWVDIDQGYETYIPYEFDKEKLEQGVNGNPKLIGMDVWKLTAVEDQSGFADPFPALFRSAMVRLYTDPNAPSGWKVCIRDGRNGKSYDWYDYQKFMPYPNMEIRKTVHAGVAVHRNNERISDIVPFKIRFHLVNDGTLSEEVPPTLDDNYVRVTLRI